MSEHCAFIESVKKHVKVYTPALIVSFVTSKNMYWYLLCKAGGINK